MVCKLWWELAAGYLYEFVQISLPTHAHLLIDAIARHPYLSLARHINGVALFLDNWEGSAPEAAVLDNMFQICPNLHVLEIHGIFGDFFDVVGVVERAAALRYFRILWDDENRAPSPLSTPLILRLSELEHLEVLFLESSGGRWYETQYNRTVLPLVHTLDMTFGDHGTAMSVLTAVQRNWVLPSLRSLSLSGSGKYPLYVLKEFLRAHGGQLTTLHLGYGPLDYTLQHVSDFCPQLVDLSTVISELNNGGNIERPPPACLRCIRLQGSLTPAAAYLEAAMRFIVLVNMPEFHTIQLMGIPPLTVSDELLVKWLSEISSECAEKLRAAGIEVTDRYGVRLALSVL
jgi:hypothetical protein